MIREKKWVSDGYDLDQLIVEISSNLAISASREEVFLRVAQLICDTMKIRSYKGLVFQSAKSEMDPEEERILIRYLESHHDVINGLPEQVRSLKCFREHFQTQIFLPIYSTSKPEGVILFEKKKSSIPFTHKDMQLFGTISRQCCLTLDWILLYEKVAREYEDVKARSSELKETFVSTQEELDSAIQWVSSTLKTELEAIGKLIDESITLTTRRSDNYDLLRLAFETINGQIDALKGFQPKLSEVSVNDMIVDILRDILPVTLEKRLVFMLDIPQNKVFAKEAIKVKICIRNLIENAVFYSPLQSTIHILITETGDFLLITISDQGAGMGNSPEHEYSTGQGLSICRTIMDQIGGELSFSSHSERGTSFFLKVKAAGKGG